MKKVYIAALSILTFASCDKKSGGADPKPVTPALTISDVVQAEGNSGTTNFVFTVTLGLATSKTVTLKYSTQDGTAKSGSDYTAITEQTLTFQPNETSKQITVSINGDEVREEEEKFTVALSNVSNANVVKSTATGTILNDDAVGEFSNLVWSDEFNENTLNTNNWAYETGDGCSINLCGWGNNELEYYTNRPENLFFKDGNMIIEARKEDFGGRNYTSAKIVSRGKKTFKYGRIEFRAKLPKGKGIWPAFWMLPQSEVYGGWPRSGELDIMEYLGHETNKVHGTVHYGPGTNGSIKISREYTLPSGTFNDDFHVFSIVWDLNEIKWYVDGNLFSTVSKSDMGSNTYPFNEEFFFIINLAVGGNWPGSPDAQTTFPQQLIVDYIRVYQ